MEEIWKDIPDYEGIYQASNLGRVRTCEGKTTFTKRHVIRHWQQRILKPKFCHSTRRKDRLDGRLELWKDGTHKTHLVARLVASAFYGKSNLTVNHIDGNPMNNNLNNLEYVSLANNMQKAFELGLYPQNKVKIINKKTRDVYTFASMSKASNFMGFSHSYIYVCKKRNIVENDVWKWELI